MNLRPDSIDFRLPLIIPCISTLEMSRMGNRLNYSHKTAGRDKLLRFHHKNPNKARPQPNKTNGFTGFKSGTSLTGVYTEDFGRIPTSNRLPASSLVVHSNSMRLIPTSSPCKCDYTTVTSIYREEHYAAPSCLGTANISLHIK